MKSQKYQISISEEVGSVSIAIDKGADPTRIILLAHGAGSDHQHPFLAKLSVGLATACNAATVRFNFPYKEKGKKLPGSPKRDLLTIASMVTWALQTYPDLPIFLAGKSYGGRMSAQWLAEQNSELVKGIIYFGYPLHAPGKPSLKKAAPLYKLNHPQLFLQGTRDALASFELIKQVIAACTQANLISVEHADHSFKIPKSKPGPDSDEILTFLSTSTSEWIEGLGR